MRTFPPEGAPNDISLVGVKLVPDDDPATVCALVTRPRASTVIELYELAAVTPVALRSSSAFVPVTVIEMAEAGLKLVPDEAAPPPGATEFSEKV